MRFNYGLLSILTLCLTVLIALSIIPSVSAIPVVVQEVKADGTVVRENSTTRLSIDRGQEFDVRVELYSTQRLTNVEVEAFIAGHSFNDVDKISDTTPVFDMEPNVVYAKKLRLTLPSRADQDNYKLRIVVADRDGSSSVHDYNLRVDAVRNMIVIRDILLNPSDYVQAGRSLLASVRIKNFGQQSEDSIKVTVSIPELGLSGVDYINRDLESDESTTSEEILLRIPSCAREGIYTVRATAEYHDLEKITSMEKQIRIVSGTCQEIQNRPSTTSPPSGTIIALDSNVHDLARGVGGAIYTVSITNNENSVNSYTLTLSGTEGVVTSRISPSNVLVIGPGQTKSAYIYLSALDQARLGPVTFSLIVNSRGETIKELPIVANIVDSGRPTNISLPKVLEAVLVLLLLVFIAVGIAVVMQNKGKRKNKEEVKQETEYY